MREGAKWPPSPRASSDNHCFWSNSEAFTEAGSVAGAKV
jgi:hypothetical protein